MLQDQATGEESYARFVRRVVAGGEVWGLKSEDGWAVCDSSESEGRSVMPFWSDRAYARRAALAEWSDYEPTRLELAQFLDPWLVGMKRDGVLVGTNWDAQNCGLEVEPDELARSLSLSPQA